MSPLLWTYYDDLYDFDMGNGTALAWHPCNDLYHFDLCNWNALVRHDCNDLIILICGPVRVHVTGVSHR